MTMGIYKIENKVNGKVYIGSSKNIENRWKQHRRMLDKKEHHSQHLQSSWDVYGSEDFSFDIIEQVEDSKKLLERESYYIQRFNSLDSNNGYNVTPVLNNKYMKVKVENSNKAVISETEIFQSLFLQFYNHKAMTEFWLNNFNSVKIFNDEIAYKAKVTNLKKEIAEFYIKLAGFIKKDNITLIDYVGLPLTDGMLAKYFEIDVTTIHKYINILESRMFLIYWIDGNNKSFLINPYMMCNSEKLNPVYAGLFTQAFGYKPKFDHLKIKSKLEKSLGLTL